MFLSNYSIGVSFPDHFIDPAKKDKEWYKQFAMAAYGLLSPTSYFIQRRNQWILNRLYAAGKQPIDKYRAQLCNAVEGEKEPTTYMNIDWRQVSVLPSSLDAVQGLLSEIDYAVQAEAVNQDAVDAKEQQKYLLWAKYQMKQERMKLEQELGVVLPIEDGEDLSWIPETFNEFSLIADMKLKLKEEIQAELGADAILDENEWSVTQTRLLEDAMSCAAMAVETRVNRETGAIECKYVDLNNLILPTMTGKTGEDMPMIGVIENITLQQVYQEAGNQLTLDQYKDLERYYQGWNGNPTSFGAFDAVSYGQGFPVNWANYRVLRMRLYMFSWDVKKFVEVKRPERKSMFKFVKYDAPERTAENQPKGYNETSGSIKCQSVHEVSWIVGTSDMVFNYGKVKDFTRDQLNKRECMLPITFYKLAEQSRVERAIPFVDSFQLSWYKMQNRKATAIPSGIRINLDAFERVLVDGRNMSTKDLLDMAVQSGVILYRPTDTMNDNAAGQAPPIDTFENDITSELMGLVSLMQADVQNIQKVTGINEFMDTSNVAPSTTATVAKISSEAVVNSLKDVVIAMNYTKSKAVIHIAGFLQRATSFGLEKMYIQKIGKFIEFENKYSLTQLGIKVMPMPLAKEKEMLAQVLRDTLLEPSSPLDLDDYMEISGWIQSAQSMKYVEERMKLRIKQRREQKAEADQKSQAAQAEAQAKMQMQQQQLIAQEAKEEHARKIELLVVGADQEIRVLQAKSQFGTQHDLVKTEAKKTASLQEISAQAIYNDR